MSSLQLAIVVASTQLLASSAFSCTNFVDHAPEQLTQLESQYTQKESQFLRMEAFAQLVCSNNTGIRTAVIRNALAGGDKDLRALAFEMLMLQKQTVIIEPFDDASGLNEAQLNYIRSNPQILYTIYYSDYENKCMSTYFQYDSECRAGSQFLVDGLRLSFGGTAQFKASFALNEEGRAIGYVVTNSGRLSVPAEVRLLE